MCTPIANLGQPAQGAFLLQPCKARRKAAVPRRGHFPFSLHDLDGVDVPESLNRKAIKTDETDSYVAKHFKTRLAGRAPAPEVLALIGGADGVRTRDLLRDRQAF